MPNWWVVKGFHDGCIAITMVPFNYAEKPEKAKARFKANFPGATEIRVEQKIV